MYRSKILMIFLSVFLLSVLFVSCDDSTGDKTYGGSKNQNAYDIQTTKNDGAIVVGESAGDLYILKVDSSGRELWSKKEGGSGRECGYAVAETADGDYIVAGVTESEGPGDPENYGSYGNVLIVKYSSNGSKMWQKAYGYDGYESAQSLQLTEDGGFIIAGYSHTLAADFYVLKCDANGNKIWDNHYGDDKVQVGRDIKVVPGNGYIISGTTMDENARTKGYIVKIDNDGNEEWHNTYGDAEMFYTINSLEIANNGGFIATGYTSNDIFPNNSSDLWILKIDSNGNFQWEKFMGGDKLDIGHDIIVGSDNGYVIAGETRSYGNGSTYSADSWIIKIDDNGNSVWTKTYGNDSNDFMRAIDITNEGGYITAGDIMSGIDYDAYLLKLDNNGNK